MTYFYEKNIYTKIKFFQLNIKIKIKHKQQLKIQNKQIKKKKPMKN